MADPTVIKDPPRKNSILQNIGKIAKGATSRLQAGGLVGGLVDVLIPSEETKQAAVSRGISIDSQKEALKAQRFSNRVQRNAIADKHVAVRKNDFLNDYQHDRKIYLNPNLYNQYMKSGVPDLVANFEVVGPSLRNGDLALANERMAGQATFTESDGEIILTTNDGIKMEVNEETGAIIRDEGYKELIQYMESLGNLQQQSVSKTRGKIIEDYTTLANNTGTDIVEVEKLVGSMVEQHTSANPNFMNFVEAGNFIDSAASASDFESEEFQELMLKGPSFGAKDFNRENGMVQSMADNAWYDMHAFKEKFLDPVINQYQNVLLDANQVLTERRDAEQAAAAQRLLGKQDFKQAFVGHPGLSADGKVTLLRFAAEAMSDGNINQLKGDMLQLWLQTDAGKIALEAESRGELRGPTRNPDAAIEKRLERAKRTDSDLGL